MHIDTTKIFEGNRQQEIPAVSFSGGAAKADAADTEKTSESGAVFSFDGRGKNNPFTYGRFGAGENDREKKGFEDIMAEAGTLNAVTMKNEMVVSANTVTVDDAKAMEEDGFSLRSMDVHTVVTETDKIKAVLAKAGKDISGMGHMSDAEIVELSGGLAASAGAIKDALSASSLPATDTNIGEISAGLEKIGSLEYLDDQAKATLIENALAPTVDNVFQAVKNGGRDYISDEALSGWTDEGFKDAIGSLFAENRIFESEENIDAAVWLMKKGIEVDASNIGYKKDLDSLKLPMGTGEALNKLTDAIYEGKHPGDALVTESLRERALDAVRVIDEATDDDLDYLIEAGLDITVDNLRQAHEAVKCGGIKPAVSEESGIKRITAKRQLEETRLLMTAEANLKLMKQGISVDTTELSKLVDDLKGIEKDYYKNLLGKEYADPSNVEIFSDIMEKTGELREMPAKALGIVFRDIEFNIENLHSEGAKNRSEYIQARESYETMGTEVRTDLGDSIKKAFSNVDDILEDLGYEPDEENRRAVRILGYNRVEIAPENIEKMKTADALVQKAFDSLKPAVVRELIKEGVNPLKMNLETLEQKAAEIRKSRSISDDTENFARYLYRLEQNEEISEEERNSYIGIYRLINNINASDGAVIGAVIESGRELSMESLLSASRSRKKGAMDYKVDDDFGGVKGSIKGESISDQINTAFRMITEPDPAADNKYYEDMLKDLQHAAAVRQSVYDAMAEYEIIPSVDNTIVMENLMQSPDTGLKRFFAIDRDDLSSDRGDDVMERLKAVKEDIFNAFAETVKTPDELAEALETLADVAEHCMQTFERDGMTALDLRQMQLACMQLNVTSRMARSHHYNIPVETSDGAANVSLKIVSSEDDKGTATIFTDDSPYGRISAKLMLKDGRVKGYIACDSRAGVDSMRERMGELDNENIDIIFSGDVNDMAYGLNGSTAVGRNELEILFDEASKLIKFFS